MWCCRRRVDGRRGGGGPGGQRGSIRLGRCLCLADACGGVGLGLWSWDNGSLACAQCILSPKKGSIRRRNANERLRRRMLSQKRTRRREKGETGGARFSKLMMLKMGCWRRPTHAHRSEVGSRITGAGPWSGAIWPLTPKHENRARSGGRYPGQGLPAKLYEGEWARVPAGLISDFPENYRSRGSRLASSTILVLLGAAIIAIAIAIAFASNSVSLPVSSCWREATRA